MPSARRRTVLIAASWLVAFTPAACGVDAVDRAEVPELSANKLDSAQRGLIKLIAETPEDESDEQSSKVPCPLGTGPEILAKAHLPTKVARTFTGANKKEDSIGCGFKLPDDASVTISAGRQDESYLMTRNAQLQQPYLGGRLYTEERAPDPSASPDSGDDRAFCSAAWVKPGRRIVVALSIKNVGGVDQTRCGPALQDTLPYLIDRLAVFE